MDLVTVNKRRLSFDLTSLHHPTSSSSPPIISDTLTITNIIAESITFKVKTNNQDRYIVRPNIGLLHSNEQISIVVSFHPSAELPPIDQPSKDKFLLRLAPITPDQFNSLPSFWQQSETDPVVRGLKFHVDFIHDNQNLRPPLLSSQAQQEQEQDQQQNETNNKENERDVNDNSMIQEQQELKNNGVDQTPQQPIMPHARELPPDLTTPSTPTSNNNSNFDSIVKTAQNMLPFQSDSQQQRQQQPQPQPQPQTQTQPQSTQPPTHEVQQAELRIEREKQQQIPDASTYEEAITRVAHFQALLDEKNLELSRLKTELAETRAQTDRVLKDAPVTPMAANSILRDPFGGISLTGFGLSFVLVILIISIIVRL